MTYVTRRVVAHGAWILTLLLLLASVALGLTRADLPVVEAPAGVAFALFSAMGALIALRRPSNPIGWIFCALGTLLALGSLMDMYALSQPPLPARRWMALGATALWPAAMGLLAQVMLRFPTGGYASRSWAWIGRTGIAGTILVAVATAVTPGRFPDFPIENPVGLEWIEGSLLEGGGVAWLGLMVGLIGGAVGLILRFRRSRGVARVQLKWFALAGALLGIGTILSALFAADLEAGQTPSLMTLVAIYFFIFALSSIPVAAAIAILRYRLYDIDLVVNRTLVYLTLTTVLATIYFVIVAAASTFAGESDLAVAAATLMVAGLFQPLRTRVQRFIDRRFYRTKYDAQRTLSEFSKSLRDELELEALARALVTVVATTLQPGLVSLWLRPRSGDGFGSGPASSPPSA